MWFKIRHSICDWPQVVVKDFNYPMSIQLRQCSTNHAYATLWLKDSYIIVLVVWKVDRCLTLYLERAFFRPCDLINQHALVHLMKIWTSMNVIHVGCPFTKKDSLGKWYWHWSIDPTWLILRKKSTGSPVDLNQHWPGVSVVQGLRNPSILEGPRIATW